MTASSNEELVYAEPGDTDLTCDIVGTRVQSVISSDDEVMVTFTGGSGLLSENGNSQKWDEFNEIQLNCGFFEHPENALVIGLMTDVLTQWKNDATPLRLLSAPGKMTTVVEDNENWLPIPCGTIGS